MREKMLKLRIPRYFYNWLWKNGPTPSQEDIHLAQLIQKVYFRIPACDLAVLREYVLDVDVVNETRNNKLGSTGTVDPNSMISGNVADIAKLNVRRDVAIYKEKLKGSDLACLFVIAHEFAHVVLRHNQMGLVLSVFAGFPDSSRYKDEDHDQIDELDEDAADLQAWVWGFDKEFRGFHQEFPKSRIPRWFMDIYQEPYMQQES